MGTERELKLKVEPSELRRLRRHSLIHTLKRGRPQTQFLKSVYFDTPDCRLRAQNMVLRVRHVGRRRIQTLKTMGENCGGAWVRGEWEHEISGDLPELQWLLDSDAAPLLGDRRLTRDLRPVFTTEIRRTIYLLGEDDWEVELALDEGQLVSAHGSAPISEIELELRHGEPVHLFDLAMRLQNGLRARVMATTKSQRGYALIDNEPPAPQKARKTVLSEDGTAAQAFQAIARSCVEQLLVNQDCLVETRDPEAVHQMRVALRRLRSAMNVFSDILDTDDTQALKEDLSWLQSYLGAARDVDVFIDEILAPLQKLLDQEPGFVALHHDFTTQRDANYVALLDIIHGGRFTRLMLSLGQWTEGGAWLIEQNPLRQVLLNRPVRQLAEAVLEKRDRKVRKRLKHLRTLPPAVRHMARIDVKKLRYAFEFFESLYSGGAAKKLGGALAKLQDRLGLLNDIAVSRERLHQHGTESKDATQLWAAGLIAGWHAARVAPLLEGADDDVAAYTRLPRLWRVKTADKGNKAEEGSSFVSRVPDAESDSKTNEEILIETISPPEQDD